MSVLPVATMEYQAGKHRLSVTARNLGEPSEIMTKLIVRSIKLWIYLAGLIEKGERETPHDKSVEMLVQEETNVQTENGLQGYTFDTWQETRVTVWDFSKHIQLTLHSDSMPQALLNIWWAMQDARLELGVNSPPSAPQAPATNAPANTAMPTSVNGVTRVTGKKTAKELPAGTPFTMPIAQIAAAMSKSGVLTYEFYGFYGGKPGQYADLLVYSDNEIAVGNGLIALLTELKLNAGESRIGRWIASGSVGEKDGKKSLFVINIQAE